MRSVSAQAYILSSMVASDWVASSANDWAQLLCTYSWSRKPKPLQTLPSRRLRLIPKPLTARETERATQWDNTRESGTGLPRLPLDIWVEIFRVGICTACNQSWHGWYCGTCNSEVPYPYHSSMHSIHITPGFLEVRPWTSPDEGKGIIQNGF